MNSQAIGVVTALLAGLAMGVGYASVVHPLAAVRVVKLLFGGVAAFDLLSAGTGAFPAADHRPPPLTGSPYERPVQQAILDVNNAISWRSVR